VRTTFDIGRGLGFSFLVCSYAACALAGALLVLDCIASGCVWVDMQATGVDVLISAPQKGRVLAFIIDPFHTLLSSRLERTPVLRLRHALRTRALSH
jgi:hypothetical protein